MPKYIRRIPANIAEGLDTPRGYGTWLRMPAEATKVMPPSDLGNNEIPAAFTGDPELHPIGFGATQRSQASRP